MRHKSKIVFLMAIMTILSAALIGCGQGGIDLQSTDWKMSTIQKESEYIAISPSKADHFPDVPAMNMTIYFSGDSLVIKDIDSGKEWKGTYEPMKLHKNDAIYNVEFEDGTEALASSSQTTYSDDSKVDTLILSADNIVIYFYAD